MVIYVPVFKYFLSLTNIYSPILNIDLNNTLCFLLVVSNSMDHLSISARQELKTLLETDNNRVVEQRVLPDHYYSQLVIRNMVTKCILDHDQIIIIVRSVRYLIYIMYLACRCWYRSWSFETICKNNTTSRCLWAMRKGECNLSSKSNRKSRASFMGDKK